MDLKAFEAWLGGIATLSELQRRQAWQALAISAAADSDDIEPRPALKQASSRLDRATRAAAAGEPGWHGQCRGAWATSGGQCWLSTPRQSRRGALGSCE
jgi:hypothetical protein